MFQPNAYTIRELMNKMPFEVFDFICDEFPDLLEMPEWKCEFVHWEPFTLGQEDADEIAQSWGYADFEDWTENGEVFATEVNNGILIIE